MYGYLRDDLMPFQHPLNFGVWSLPWPIFYHWYLFCILKFRDLACLWFWLFQINWGHNAGAGVLCPLRYG